MFWGIIDGWFFEEQKGKQPETSSKEVCGGYLIIIVEPGVSWYVLNSKNGILIEWPSKVIRDSEDDKLNAVHPSEDSQQDN